jgi:hypothetical protein
MKKIVKKLLKILAYFILSLFLILLITPLLFKKQIKEQVVKIANENIEAKLSFNDFGVSLIRHFPNFTFNLKEVYIVGNGSFEGDTLAGFKSFGLVFDLGSIVGKKGYNVKSIIIDKPVVHGVVLADGSANWDIMKEAPEKEEIPEDLEEEGSSSSVKMRLQNFEIRNATIRYDDFKSGMNAGFDNLDLKLSGNMSAAYSDMIVAIEIVGLDFYSDGARYLNKANITGNFDLKADLENNRYELGENTVSLNEILFSLSGVVSLVGETIETDLVFKTGDTGFKQVLSLVPAIYMKGYEDIKADGIFGFSGTAAGVYSSADSIYPDITLDFFINSGSINYPALPGTISDINVKFNADINGTNPDKSLFNLNLFHFELAGNPFDMNFSMQTPISDPNVSGAVNGRIDLKSLASALPLELDKLSGLIDIGLSFGGRYSMVESGDYESFKADGSIKFADIELSMDGLPPVVVNTGLFTFSPRNLALSDLNINIAGSDIKLSGAISNYIAYALRGETIIGKLTLNSNLIDAGEIISFMPSDTVETVGESSPLDIILIPENIDFTFNSTITKFLYPPLNAGNLRGNIFVRNGMVTLEETGLETLGGKIDLDVIYDTRDTLNPIVKGSMSASGIAIKSAFETFNTVQKLAPVAEGMDGDVSVIFDFKSILGKGMMPVTDSITGRGRFEAESIEILSSPVFEKFSKLFKLDDSFSNTFNDVAVEFRVENGRVHIKPFDTKMGVVKMNIGGSHGLDQTMSYVVKTEMPTKFLPESLKGLISNMAAQAALIGIKYEQPAVMKVNLAIGGTVKDPIIMPTLGGMGEGTTMSGAVKEVAKEAVKEAAKEVVDDAKEKISNEVAKQAEKIVKEAEERAETIRAEANNAAAKIRNEAATNAQKLVDEASSKGAIAKLAADKASKALINEAEKKAKLVEDEGAKKADALVEEAKARAAQLSGKNE